MRKRHASRTAQFVAFLRALATLAPTVPGFADPVAEHMLPPRWAGRVARTRAALRGGRRTSPFPFWARGMGVFNQFRTAVLDRAIAEAAPFAQLVILGAGLDTRAWRLPALGQTTAFEVDHPDTQALKRSLVANRPSMAPSVRFVPVDFTRDDLAAALLNAGFAPQAPTFWLWEGVVMYLTADAVAQTLRTVAALSQGETRLAATYMTQDQGGIPRSWFLALIGEPCRSAFDPPAWDAFAAQCGWNTVSNTGTEDWLKTLTPGFSLTRKQVGLQWLEHIWIGQRAPSGR